VDTGLLVLTVIVVVLLVWAIYQITRIQLQNEKLRQRVERLHTKVNSIRRAVAAEPHRDDESTGVHPAIDAAAVARQH
jgi:hypothetical protein